jgi:hypothetical protein
VDFKDFILFYNIISQNKRVASGVAILLKQSWRNGAHNYNFVSDRIIIIRPKTRRGYLSAVGVHAPGEGNKDGSIEFC